MITASISVFHDYLPCSAIVCKNIYGTKISSLLQVLSVGRENVRTKCVPSLHFFLSFYPILDLVLVHMWDKLWQSPVLPHCNKIWFFSHTIIALSCNKIWFLSHDSSPTEGKYGFFSHKRLWLMTQVWGKPSGFIHSSVQYAMFLWQSYNLTLSYAHITFMFFCEWRLYKHWWCTFALGSCDDIW